MQSKGGHIGAGDFDVTRPTVAAKGLDGRLLGSEARGQMTARARSGTGGFELTGAEEPRCQAWPAPQRQLDPVDLDQVDSEPRYSRGDAHGVITAAVASELESVASLTPSTMLAVVRSPSAALPLTM